MLKGKTVWVVEPERFSAYALERRLRDLCAKRVVLMTDAETLQARLADAGEGDDAPSIAIIDCMERPEGGRNAAEALRARDVAVVCTVDTARDCDAAGPDDVPKPYAMVDVERAIARHYGLTI